MEAIYPEVRLTRTKNMLREAWFASAKLYHPESVRPEARAIETECHECGGRHQLPEHVVDAVASAYESAVHDDLDGWEIELIGKRIRECVAKERLPQRDESSEEKS